MRCVITWGARLQENCESGLGDAVIEGRAPAADPLGRTPVTGEVWSSRPAVACPACPRARGDGVVEGASAPISIAGKGRRGGDQAASKASASRFTSFVWGAQNLIAPPPTYNQGRAGSFCGQKASTNSTSRRCGVESRDSAVVRPGVWPPATALALREPYGVRLIHGRPFAGSDIGTDTSRTHIPLRDDRIRTRRQPARSGRVGRANPIEKRLGSQRGPSTPQANSPTDLRGQ